MQSETFQQIIQGSVGGTSTFNTDLVWVHDCLFPSIATVTR